jgi:hypothetical protein
MTAEMNREGKREAKERGPGVSIGYIGPGTLTTRHLLSFNIASLPDEPTIVEDEMPGNRKHVEKFPGGRNCG